MITSDRLQYETYPLELTDKVEMFLRREFPGHLAEISQCSTYSYRYALGEEERAKEDDEYCKSCDINF